MPASPTPPSVSVSFSFGAVHGRSGEIRNRPSADARPPMNPGERPRTQPSTPPPQPEGVLEDRPGHPSTLQLPGVLPKGDPDLLFAVETLHRRPGRELASPAGSLHQRPADVEIHAGWRLLTGPHHSRTRSSGEQRGITVKGVQAEEAMKWPFPGNSVRPRNLVLAQRILVPRQQSIRVRHQDPGEPSAWHANHGVVATMLELCRKHTEGLAPEGSPPEPALKAAGQLFRPAPTVRPRSRRRS